MNFVLVSCDFDIDAVTRRLFKMKLVEDQSGRRTQRRGYLNPERVRSISFWTTSACILVAVVSSLLAIWRFTGTDILWRTVATCVVIAAGTLAFSFLNAIFGYPPE
jgi:hypothetical protein